MSRSDATPKRESAKKHGGALEAALFESRDSVHTGRTCAFTANQTRRHDPNTSNARLRSTAT
jgi:hypothetical protein